MAHQSITNMETKHLSKESQAVNAFISPRLLSCKTRVLRLSVCGNIGQVPPGAASCLHLQAVLKVIAPYKFITK
jgi:hypothetical protein